jgi:hypothetical protein
LKFRREEGVVGGRISIGVIIGVILIVYWYMKDHPQTVEPVRQSYEYGYVIGV